MRKLVYIWAPNQCSCILSYSRNPKYYFVARRLSPHWSDSLFTFVSASVVVSWCTRGSVGKSSKARPLSVNKMRLLGRRLLVANFCTCAHARSSKGRMTPKSIGKVTQQSFRSRGVSGILLRKDMWKLFLSQAITLPRVTFNNAALLVAYGSMSAAINVFSISFHLPVFPPILPTPSRPVDPIRSWFKTITILIVQYSCINKNSSES